MAARVRLQRVVVAARVTRGGHEEDAVVTLRGNGVHQGLREEPTTPAVVGGDDLDAALLHGQHVVQARDGARRGAEASRVEELARQDPHVPRDAADAICVVASGADDPGDVRAMAVVVVRVTAMGDRVEPVAVVHDAVAVVVRAVGRAFDLVAEQVVDEVDMQVVDARIEDGHHDLRAAGRDVPCFDCVDARMDLQRPLRREEWVVRSVRKRLHDEVGLGVLHVRMTA